MANFVGTLYYIQWQRTVEAWLFILFNQCFFLGGVAMRTPFDDVAQHWPVTTEEREEIRQFLLDSPGVNA